MVAPTSPLWVPGLWPLKLLTPQKNVQMETEMPCAVCKSRGSSKKQGEGNGGGGERQQAAVSNGAPPDGS